jgi:hypothetical protein
VQYGGFTVTPFFGAIFNHVLQGRDYHFGLLRLNMYTAPAYFMILVVSSVVLVLSLFFQNRQRLATVSNPKTKRREAIDHLASQRWCCNLTVVECCIYGCMLLNVATKGSIACFETLGVSIAQTHFYLSSAMAATIVATCGTGGVVALLCMGELSKFVNDIQLIVGGILVMCAGIWAISFLEEGAKNPSWHFMLSIFLVYSIGYPIGHTAVIGLFSKSKSIAACSFSFSCTCLCSIVLLSYWQATARRIARVVRLGWFSSPHGLSHCFWIYCRIPWLGCLVPALGHCLDDVGNVYFDLVRNAAPAVVLERKCSC